MTVTVSYCPICWAELDRRETGFPTGLVVRLDESFEDALRRELELEAAALEEIILSHLERRHPFRVWLNRCTRGLLGIGGVRL